ncbi:helix-turn-helix transcriptional regulator [Salimicrobium halophilum]|uniref:Transcriptional regulator, contains XRE-family HTH domain n=1 Tax=Salimicrobium halophilum TaxID=86666 RepID=A0A1G8SD42_9BACI|nr:helix-turn-helix transcriptional regulator [Salimicrobium halophilum]SDJ27176.1 Transcriptional regulator, contains XRE-family HTH domain [Salimicrobium halophilum]
MDLGTKLRFVRKKKNMTLAELADGIISVSYLSKIENNDNIPDKEVISLLFEKLDTPAPQNLDSSTMDDLDEWYKVVVHKESDQADTMFEELSGVISEHDIEEYVRFEIFKIKYYLMVNHVEKAEEVMEGIADYEDTLNVRNFFYYHRFKALYDYTIQDFQSALTNVKKAEAALPTLLVEEWDLADLCYFMGLINSRLRKTTNCIFYTNKALEYYNAKYQYERAAECHILLGISYERIHEYEKTEESFLLADKLAHLLNNTYIKGLVSHNLGYLYSIQNDYQKALDYYIASIEYKKQTNTNVNYTLNTILCIVIEHYNAGYMADCETWIEEGISLMKQHHHKHSREYYYHFYIYDYLVDDSRDNELASFIEEGALPYFEEKKHVDYIVKYAYILGQHFKKLYKYKKANHYYEVSLRTIKNNHHLGGIIL